MNDLQSKQLQRAKDHANAKCGECLSTEYRNCETKLDWKCANPEHQNWLSSFDKVVNSGRWCPQCARERTPHNKHINGLEIAKAHAKSKGGECLSTDYVNADGKLVWKCANPGHEPWEATYTNVVNSKCWCYQRPPKTKELHQAWCFTHQCSLYQGAMQSKISTILRECCFGL